MHRTSWLATLLIPLGIGCGDGGGGAADAGAADAGDDCGDWPIETSTAGGTVELGTGAVNYAPMPDRLQFIEGTQSGTFLILHSRIKDLDPGNPDDGRDPTNPKTKYSAVLADGSTVGRCLPSTQGYKPDDEDGYFIRKSFYNLEFLPFSVGEAAFDTTLRIRVEVIDSDGKYAMDEKDVFCAAPVDWNDAGPGDGGPDGDAGLLDAGADAGGDEPDASR